MGEEEGGLVLLAGAAHVADQEEGGSGGAPRRSTPADRAARAKRGRAIVAAVDDVADAPAPKRHRGGAQVGPSGRHGVYERTEEWISMGTSCLTWRAGLCVAGHKSLHLGGFPTVDDAARAYDAEVRRRGWAHVRPLNFPQPEEVAAYTPHAGERCDERGLPVSLALEPPAVAQSAAAAYGAANQRSHSTQKPGKSGFFGVTRLKSKASPWQVTMHVPNTQACYVVGYFTTKDEAARAYDVEVRRRGWTHLKRLNFPDPADDAALLPSSAEAGEPGPE